MLEDEDVVDDAFINFYEMGVDLVCEVDFGEGE